MMTRVLTIRPRVQRDSLRVPALLLAALCAQLLLLSPAGGAVPDRFTFQGVLTSDEEPFTGTAHLEFAIYTDSSGGTALWTQDYGDTPITNGLYTVTLGPFPELTFDQLYWLEVSVDGTALSPRYPLLSVPYSLRAATADAVATGAVDEAAILDGSLTAADIGTNIVSSVAGVANDGGDIDLVAGANITITPDDAANAITIAATAGGDVTDVLGGAGLSSALSGGPQVTLEVGAGLGIEVTDDEVQLADAYSTGSAYDARFVNEGDAGDVTGVDGGAGLVATDSGGPEVSLDIIAGTGIEVTDDAVQLAETYVSGEAYDERFVNEDEAGSVTSEMIAPEVVSGISGVTNDGGNVELIAGENITITPDDDANTITIAAAGGAGGGGDVTEVVGGNGLISTNQGGPVVTLDIGEGRGIDVVTDAISVDPADFAGGGLRIDGSGDMEVSTSTGLEISSDQVRLTTPYSTGSAYDDRFMNEGAEASGDLGGSYPDPTVVKLRGRAVNSTAPTSDQVLAWNGSAWAPADDGLHLPYEDSGDTAGIAMLEITHTAPSGDFPAILGTHDVTDYYGVGVKGVGGYKGVDGRVTPEGSHTYYAVYGEAMGGSGTCYGTYGIASTSGSAYGVYGHASGSGTAHGVHGYATSSDTACGVYGAAGGTGTKYAGYFYGPVHVSGTLSKGGGAFRIDHPLDPLNKYLQHSFVESPDMMNVYNGNVVTDARGYATVTLPDWFQALNRDFRYQLTVLDDADSDAFVQTKVVRKVEKNTFVIRTSAPLTEVSWQVTGIRQDRFANENRIQVEVEKPAKERGKYVHPTAYGLPEEEGIGYVAPQDEDKQSDPAVGSPSAH